jgi:hypothetical protein
MIKLPVLKENKQHGQLFTYITINLQYHPALFVIKKFIIVLLFKSGIRGLEELMCGKCV